MFLGAYDLVNAGFLARKALKVVTSAFTHSKDNLDLMNGMGLLVDRFHVVHRGLPLKILKQGGESRVPGRIAAVGSLEPAKNTDGIIKVVAEVRKRGKPVSLDVFGDGPERQKLEQLAARLGMREHVVFHGHRPREEVFEALSVADIFIFLSKKKSERLPNAVKEAMYAGCSVIVSDSVGIRELIPGPAYGQIVNPDDLNSILAALERYADEDESSKQERVLRNRRLIEESFSSTRSMARYCEVWHEGLRQIE